MYTTQASMKLVDSAEHGEGAELFVVEGDSAARSVVALRNRRNQAVLPLQGKPLNAWKAGAGKVTASPLYRQLAQALGARDPLTQPDAADLRYGRIVLLMDPDADGVHISALVLLYFKRWMPGLLAAGRVVVVRAPMYAISPAPGEPPVFAYSSEHRLAMLAGLRQQGCPDADAHGYLGLGSIPPDVLRACCIDPATRTSRVAGEDDVAAVMAAFRFPRHPD